MAIVLGIGSSSFTKLHGSSFFKRKVIWSFQVWNPSPPNLSKHHQIATWTNQTSLHFSKENASKEEKTILKELKKLISFFLKLN
jgi:hypothetical protein